LFWYRILYFRVFELFELNQDYQVCCDGRKYLKINSKYTELAVHPINK